MSTKLFTYIPESVVLLLAGIYPVRGFVDGTFIEVTKDVVPFTSRRTSDGTVSRLYNNDQTYAIDITLHNGSEANDFLTKLWQLDELTQRGKFPVMIKDPSGSDLFFSTTTWIEGIPPLVKSSGISERTWTLRSSQAIINIGSNQDPSSIVGDLINIATSALPSIEGLI